MIRYTLKCENAHEFEGWFASSSAFDAQERQSQVACPHCGSHEVEKAVMAPNIATGKDTETSGGKSSPELLAEAEAMARKLRDYVEKNADDVGDRFADEARKIHYKESEERGIYGSATTEEVKDLEDEGIPFEQLPRLPEDHN